MAKDFYQQLGIGVASLTFGVALSIFIYAAFTGIVNSLQAWLLYLATFLLMLRFWFRYSELFVMFLPSHTFWHFLLDFAVAFFGISAVLFVNTIQTWALIGMLAMLASAVRCSLSWKDAKRDSKPQLKKTLLGAVIMIIVLSAVYLFAPLINQLMLAVMVFVLVAIFVVYTSLRK